MRLSRLKIVLAAAAIAVLHLASLPRTIWEYDESLFALAVESYRPLLHHPPPPGYPLYIALAKLAALFTDPFRALIAISVVATIAGFVFWVLAFRTIAGENAAIIAALLLFSSPSVLISGVLPQSDAGALALFAAAAWACSIQGAGRRGQAELAALLCALCIGWRLQFSIAVVPMFLVALMLMKTWRDRLAATTVFGVACLAWLVPLVAATGGPESYWKWLSGQAAYYAAHDADLSRSGLSTSHIALRFVAHPWGPKWLSLPLLALAAGGAVYATLKRNARILPLAAGCLVYLTFAATTMDPADAVRYAIPSLPLLALLAGMMVTLPLERLTTQTNDASAIRSGWLTAGAAVAVALLYAAGSYRYASPVLRARATSDSPPVAAANWIRANASKDTVLLYDLPLGPHVQFLLRDWKAMRVDAGMAAYGDQPDVPLLLYADGEGERTFRWPDTDAYRKLTRRHYGAVSVTAIRRTQRYRAVEGVSAPERTRDGLAWRWLGARAILELPDLGANRVRLTFRAPPECPIAENRVRVEIHGRTTFVTVQRNASSTLVLPLPPGPARITITPEQTFVPANVPGARNRDKRTLSVMLTGVEQSSVP